MQSDRPDMSKDIDALFDHMLGNLGHEMDDIKDWMFNLRSADLDRLEAIADELDEEFTVQIVESVEEIDADGNSSMGPPLLCVVIQDALLPDEVKSLAERFKRLAQSQGVSYEGVSCYEPTDEDELEQLAGQGDGDDDNDGEWMDIEEAVSRLEQLTSAGLAEGAEMVLVVCIQLDENNEGTAIGKDLSRRGFMDVELAENDEGETAIIAACAVNNDAKLLRAKYDLAAQIAETGGGELVGVRLGLLAGEEDEGED